jgi:hypothetical protein
LTASKNVFLVREPVSGWSLAALAAGAFAAVLDGIVLVADQNDLSELNWPLLLLPVALVPAPVAWPRTAVRVAAAAAMAAWCALGIFSVGMFFLPCLVLMVIAAARGL